MSAAEILRLMAAEQEGAATAAAERAKMADRSAEARSHAGAIDAARSAGDLARAAIAHHQARAQALLDGAQLIEAATRSST